MSRGSRFSSDEYPFESRYLDVGGPRHPEGQRHESLGLHYIDEGQGEPVLMVHGNPSWSFYFRKLISALTRREESKHGKEHGKTYRAIAPDHIGCGLSDKPSDADYEYTLSRRIDDLEKLIDHLEIKEPISLVLHDWGGMIGMGLAARMPERIGRIIILNTAAFPLPETKKMPTSLTLCRLPFLGALLVRRFNGFCRGAAKHGVTREPLSPEARRGLLAPYDSWKNRIAVHRFVQDIPLRPSDRAYPVVQQTAESLDRFRGLPMLIAWGEQDFVFDGHFLDEWIRRFPDAEVHRFPDSGHYVLEDSSDRIVPLAMEFFEKHALERIQ